ncbi:MAG TPA: MarR family transcriptional regulator [Actinomycetota bacterium]|nr:MarR family transcriptional regulator [Actinomycetota bacterium]
MSTNYLAEAAHDSELSTIDRSLTILRRWGNLPRIRERYEAVMGNTPIDKASYRLLVRLDEQGPSRLSDLAERVGVDLSTASRQVHALQAAGFVAREAVEEDRRAALLRVTDAGKAMVGHILEARRTVITELLAGWTPEERDELARILGRLADDIVAYGCRPAEPGAEL